MHFHNKRYETRYGAKKYAEGKEENSIYAVRGICHDGKRKEYQREKRKKNLPEPQRINENLPLKSPMNHSRDRGPQKTTLGQKYLD